MLHKIVKLTVTDVRFPTSLEQHGSDAMVRKLLQQQIKTVLTKLRIVQIVLTTVYVVSTPQHTDPDYSAAYVVLETDCGLKGFGLTFTLGKGTEIGNNSFVLPLTYHVIRTCCVYLQQQFKMSATYYKQIIQKGYFLVRLKSKYPNVSRVKFYAYILTKNSFRLLIWKMLSRERKKASIVPLNNRNLSLRK